MKTRFFTTNAEAILWVTTATALFSLIFASGKFAGDTASVFQINFLRHCGGLLTLCILLLWHRQPLRYYASQRPFSHFIRAVFGVFGALAIIQSSSDMPLVDSTALSLLYVVFVLILGVVIFHERIGRRQWGGILLCGAGAVVIMAARGAFRQFDVAYVVPAGLALFGALLFAFEGIFIKILSQHDRPMTVLLHVNVFGILLLLIPAILAWQDLPVGSALGYMALGPLGIIAQYCVIRGYRMADISVVGPADYSWLIFAALIGYFFFGELPTSTVWIGAALIAGGGIVLATVKPAKEKQPVPEML